MKSTKHIVVSPFRDIHNFSLEYTVGTDVSHFSESRLKHLLSIGYVEAIETAANQEDEKGAKQVAKGKKD